MKTFLLKSPKRILALASLAGICGLSGNYASAQATHKERVYADFQGTAEKGVNLGLSLLTGSVTNPTNAISASIRDSSTLAYSVSAIGLVSATQYLQFTTDGSTPKTIPADSAIYVKVKLPKSLISVLDNIQIGTFTNLHQVNGDLTRKAGYDATETPVITKTNLANLLNGAGTVEFKVVSDIPSNGVYLKVASTLGVASSANLFYAYTLEDKPGDPGCPEPIDWLNGTDATLSLDLASATGATTNPQSAIDGDLNTAATFSTGVQAASLPYYTAIFNNTAKAGDSVRIVINNPNGGLLNVGLLTSFSIQAYNDDVPVGPAIVNDPTLLKVQLLPNATDKNVLTAAIPGDFNRVKITMGGVADLSSLLGNGTLNIYEIGVAVPAPAPITETSEHYAYNGTTVDLNEFVTENGNEDAIVWYDAPVGGNAVNHLVAVDGDKTYYAASLRNGCSNASDRTAVYILKTAGIKPTDPEAAHVGEPYSGQLIIGLDGASTLPNEPVYTLSNIKGTFTPANGGDATTFNIDANAFNRYAMAKMPAIFAAGPSAGLLAQFADTTIGNGLTMDENGHITGTPEEEGSISITADVFDAANGLEAGSISSALSIGAALPVEMSDLSLALDNDKNVVVSWTTESESGSIRFDVQRSNDGVNFEKIGSVKAAGVSTHAINYSFTDNNPGAKSYYRLDIVKNDGVKTSRTVSISGGKVAGFSINPSPATNHITISGISADNIQVVNIYDAAGRLVSQASSNRVNVQNLSQGIYFVTVVTKDGNTTKAKFIKK